MPDQKPIKVIIDTNLWISFLIGKQLTRENHQSLESDRRRGKNAG